MATRICATRDKYSSVSLHAGREHRREEATARQKIYDNLTMPQIAELIMNRPGKSVREIQRVYSLTKQLIDTGMSVEQASTFAGKTSISEVRKYLKDHS